VKSYTTDEFWELYRALPEKIRRQAQEAHEQFERDPFHPGLNFEEVDTKRHLWSARITRGYRADTASLAFAMMVKSTGFGLARTANMTS